LRKPEEIHVARASHSTLPPRGVNQVDAAT
jgi:hypothetical protein